MIEGLSHITFIVRDLDRMERILIEVLGARKVYDSGPVSFSISDERFFLAGDIWIAIMKGEPLAERTYNHVAFKIRQHQIAPAIAAIEQLGLDVRAPRPRVAGEGTSIYFYDDDNHLFELHTGTLDERLARYARDPS
jgi:catechol 2,3-dioxygenase-like lactoylglutathione lyase family enzyme